jgi:hypothetical protein
MFVRKLRAHEGEIVQIDWTYRDGTKLEEQRTAPPLPVANARIAHDLKPCSTWTEPALGVIWQPLCARCAFPREAHAVVDLTGDPPLACDDPKRGGGL